MAQDNRLTGQLSLEGFDAPRKVEPLKKKVLRPPSPVGTDRLFFAILPPAAVADEIAKRAQRLCEQHGFQGDPLLRKHFHITLSHLGDCVGVPDHIVNTVSQVANSLALPPFEVTFDRVISFSHAAGKKPFVLRGGSGLAALLSFQKRLVQGISDAEIWSGPGFTPHLTLAYDNQDVPEQSVEPIQWTVREFVLVHSLLLGQTQHKHLGRWSLSG